MKNFARNSMIAMVVVTLFGLGTYAAAGPGWGRGMHRGGGDGDDCPRYGYGPGAGYAAQSELTEAQLQKLEQERNAFRIETEPLRNDLYSKQLALRSELAKENTDVKKAAELQKEISNLEAQLDQKRLDHMLKVKEINPSAGAEFHGGKGYGPGYGGGRGGMMGYGPGAYGGGYCWR